MTSTHIKHIFFIIVLSASSVGQANAGYTFIDLGTSAQSLGNSQAYGINNAGQVVGYANNGDAALWSGSTFTGLGAMGGTYAIGYSINNFGQVAGSSIHGGYGTNVQAAVWNSVNATGVTLQNLGASYNFALSINDAGQVAGFQQAGSSDLRPIRWDGTVATDIGTLGGTYGSAYAINNAGQIAGYSSTSGNAFVHATVWSGTKISDLGTLGGTRSEAKGINDAGQVVGYSYLSGDAVGHATFWNGVTITDLGTLGGAHSYGNSINNSGQIVGVSSVIGDSLLHATLWTGTTAVDLNSFADTSFTEAGWVLTDANDINDSGWIVGSAYNRNRQEYHAFLLSTDSIATVSEPESLVLLLTALCLLGVFARQNRVAKN